VASSPDHPGRVAVKSGLSTSRIGRRWG
jgi:hypothetical protein